MSSFLWIGQERLFLEIIGRKVLIPFDVWNEIQKVSFLSNKLEKLINNGDVLVKEIYSDTKAEEIYDKLCFNPGKNRAIIGKGEGACIALAVEFNGAVGSNNLRDVKQYCKEYNIRLITTTDILIDAYQRKRITLNQGNSIWKQMLDKRRKLPFDSFAKCLSENGLI